MKTCTKCGISKSLDSFSKRSNVKDGRTSHCKECHKSRDILNKDRKAKKNQDWYLKNTSYALQKSKDYRNSHVEELKLYQKQYRSENKEYLNKISRERYASDIEYKLSKRLRTRLIDAVSRGYKTGSAVSDLGCSIKDFKEYLESLFQPGMTWDNYGEWHMDHIRPLSSFCLSDREQLLIACNYINIQPLWAKDNFLKSDKWENKQ